MTAAGLVVVGLVATIPAPSARADSGPSQRVLRVAVDDRAQLDRLAQEFDLWGYDAVSEEAILQVSDAQLDALVAQVESFEVDLERTATLARLGQPLAGQQGGIPGFPCYRTVEETFASAENLTLTHPHLATWIDIGDSWEKTQNPEAGYDLFVLRLTRGVSSRIKPRLFVNTGLHAREYATAELATRFAEHLVAHYDRDPDITWLLDHHEVHLLLHANPDGRKRAEGGFSWRKNANNDYCTGSSSRGADLNRNFGFQWNCCGGSSDDECSNLYHGAAASSEPEIQAIETYLRSIFPDQRPPDLDQPAADDARGIMLDIHSFGEDVLWSWGFVTPPPPEPNGSALYTLGRKYGFFTHYRPQHGSFNTVDGATKDFAYGELGVPGFTIELGTDFFEDCKDFDNIIVRDNVQALIYAAKAVRLPYLLPAGPDVVSPTVPPTAIGAGEPVALRARVDDGRYTSLNGSEPVQDVAAAAVFVDVPPWREGAVGLPLEAVDGAFDSSEEEVVAVLDTASLAPGRHLLFVQGQDAVGSVGVVSAAFLHVIDPQRAPIIEGFLQEAITGQPLAGTVRLGDFEASSDPGTGFYRMQVPAGTYEVVAETAGHARQSLLRQLDDFSTVEQSFALRPYVDVLSDDAEGSGPPWTADAPWARSDEVSLSPRHAWSDSPGGDYDTSTDISLTSPLLDLSGLEETVLVFHQLVDIEQHRDYGLVQVSLDDGGTWQTVAVESGEDRDRAWQRREVPLPQLDGRSQVRLRFRLDSDSFTVADGWHLDDIQLRALAVEIPGSLFFDGFESGDTGSWSAGLP